jgi:cysteine synthase A
MSHVFTTMLDTIGNTPLVKLNRLFDPATTVLAKMEPFNPLGSVKDRIARSMIDAAEASGDLKPGATVIEPTSGNTGIGLAFVCGVKGYRCVLTMPESASIERRKVMRALGAQVILTDAAGGMPGAITRAQELLAETESAYMPMQFDNPANPKVHFETTGPEIWDAAKGKVDVFVAGVGTGGTLTGAGKFLKSMNPDLQVIAIEPAESPVISQTRHGDALVPGPHKIQGIGAGFIPSVLDLDLIDDVITITGDEAIDWARRASREEGLFVGISSGAALAAVNTLVRRDDLVGKTIATVIPSFGERYLSSPLFADILE